MKHLIALILIALFLYGCTLQERYQWASEQFRKDIRAIDPNNLY